MAKRLGRTVVNRPAAAVHSYAAKMVGGTAAPLAGNCRYPVTIPVTGIADKATSRLMQFANDPGIDYAPGHGLIGAWSDPAVVHADLDVRCRRCEACLRARAAHWRERAKAELAFWPRTWFATLTLSPDNHWKHHAWAEAYLRAQGIEPTALQADHPDDWFRYRCAPLVDEVQLWLKRLRKSAGRLRTMYVIERHKSGEPHIHALIHEAPDKVLHRQLTDAWKLGFSSHKLAEPGNAKVAFYLCKYLTKDFANRPRASRHYGQPVRAIIPKLQTNFPPSQMEMTPTGECEKKIRHLGSLTTQTPDRNEAANTRPSKPHNTMKGHF